MNKTAMSNTAKESVMSKQTAVVLRLAVLAMIAGGVFCAYKAATVKKSDAATVVSGRIETIRLSIEDWRSDRRRVKHAFTKRQPDQMYNTDGVRGGSNFDPAIDRRRYLDCGPETSRITGPIGSVGIRECRMVPEVGSYWRDSWRVPHIRVDMTASYNGITTSVSGWIPFEPTTATMITASHPGIPSAGDEITLWYRESDKNLSAFAPTTGSTPEFGGFVAGAVLLLFFGLLVFGPTAFFHPTEFSHPRK